VLRLVVELPLLSVNVHRRPLAVATVVTQLVTQRPPRPEEAIAQLRRSGSTLPSGYGSFKNFGMLAC
jgi:hypothetical protein